MKTQEKPHCLIAGLAGEMKLNGPFAIVVANVVANVVAIVVVVVIVVAIVAAAVSVCLLGQFSETRDAREYFMTSFRIICDFFFFFLPRRVFATC